MHPLLTALSPEAGKDDKTIWVRSISEKCTFTNQPISPRCFLGSMLYVMKGKFCWPFFRFEPRKGLGLRPTELLIIHRRHPESTPRLVVLFFIFYFFIFRDQDAISVVTKVTNCETETNKIHRKKQETTYVRRGLLVFDGDNSNFSHYQHFSASL